MHSRFVINSLIYVEQQLKAKNVTSKSIVQVVIFHVLSFTCVNNSFRFMFIFVENKKKRENANGMKNVHGFIFSNRWMNHHLIYILKCSNCAFKARRFFPPVHLFGIHLWNVPHLNFIYAHLLLPFPFFWGIFRVLIIINWKGTRGKEMLQMNEIWSQEILRNGSKFETIKNSTSVKFNAEQ